MVQHPDDALYPEMPRNALEHVEVAHCEPVQNLGQLLVRLVNEPAGPSPAIPEEIARETSLNLHAGVPGDAETPFGQLSPLTCPDCGGSLSELQDGLLLRYRCHTGHAYDARHLLGAQTETVERALWSAVRAHEERATLLRRLAHQARANNALAAARRWEEHLEEREEEANVIRRLLLHRPAAESEAEMASERRPNDRSGDERPGGLTQAFS